MSPDSVIRSAENLFVEFLTAEELGEKLDFEALCRAHPSHAAELKEHRRRHEQALAHFERLGLKHEIGRSIEAKFELLREARESELASVDAAESLAKLTALTVERLRKLGPNAERYESLGEINRGGMGAIVKVRDKLLQRTLAMKVLLGSSDERQHARLRSRLLQEALITGRLEHPGIVPVHEMGLSVDKEDPFFTMKLVKGRSLDEIYELVVQGDPQWTQTRVLQEVLLRVCETMSYAHAKGVIHRDLKPSNVMVGDYGEVYVMDWGLARQAAGAGDETGAEDGNAMDARAGVAAQANPAAGVTRLGQRIGTPEYMSPEQARGEHQLVGPATDIYAIGVMLYRLIAGRSPYVKTGERVHDHAEVVRRVQAGPPPALESIVPSAPPELVAICDKAMAREIAGRYASMGELAKDLRAYVEGRVVQAHRSGPLIELRKWIGRNRATAASLAAALLAVSAGGGAFVWQRSQNEVLAMEKTLGEQKADSDLKASEATMQRRELAQSHYTTARLGSQRGAWNDVLASIDRARGQGYEDTVELDLLEAEARIATGRSRQAKQKLERIGLERASSAQRGRIQLAWAEIELTPMGSVEAAFERVRAALEEELAPADLAFAQGMIADRTLDALDSFGEALSVDPFHFGAMNARLTTLYFLGRYEEALRQAEVQRELFPDDPSAQVLLAMVASATGNPERANELFEQLEPVLGKDVVQIVLGPAEIVAAFNQIPVSAVIKGFRQADVAPVFKRFGELMFANPVADAETTRSLMIPKVAPVAKAYQALSKMLIPEGNLSPGMLTGLVAGLWDKVPLVDQPKRCAVELEEILRYHDDGLFHFFLGVALLTTPLEKREKQADKLRRCLPVFERAAQAPCMVPKISRMARFLAGRCFNDLIAGAEEPVLRSRAIAMIQGMQIDAQTDWDEVSLFGSLAMTCGILSEGLRLVDDWIELHPEDIGARASRTNALRMLGAPERALQEAEELLKVHPEHQKLRQSREAAVQAIEARPKRESR